MTDLENFPLQRTLVKDPNRGTSTGETGIESVTNGDGEQIANGGISKNADLSFVGFAAPNQKAQLLDNGIPAHPRVNVDSTGHFSVIVPGQENGMHDYTVQSDDGQVSDPFTIHISVVNARISWVSGPNGEVIENGQSTHILELSFVGQGEPNTTVRLLDNGVLVDTLNIDENAHWSAALSQLAVGAHKFTVIGSDDVESPGWNIEILKSQPLSIQFLLGESGQLIGNHDQTTDTSVVVVGTANAHETLNIVDYDAELVQIQADSNGIYTAKVSNLAVKAHTIRAVTALGRVSAPWAFRVMPAKAR